MTAFLATALAAAPIVAGAATIAAAAAIAINRPALGFLILATVAAFAWWIAS